MTVAAWTTATLGDVCRVIRGITFPASAKQVISTQHNVCCLRTTNIQRQIEWDDVYYVPRHFVKREEQLVRVGDVLMSMANSYELVGKVAMARDLPRSAAFGAFLAAIRPSEAVDVRFIFYWLRTPEIQRALREGSSQTTNIANISVSRLARLEIPLPPLTEQRCIADKLDRLLATVDTCKARLAALPSILKRFRQSVLAAATSGKLTEAWRADRGIAFEWDASTVQAVAEVGTGSTPLRTNLAFYSESGTPWITSAATARPMVRESVEFVTEAAITAHRLKKYPIGTLLVAMYGEGKTRGQVTELGIEATINQACAAIVVDAKRVEPGFIKLSLQANYLRMRQLAEGGNQPNLNLSKIKEFPLLIPRDADEQIEAVRRVDELFALADRVESRCAAVLDRVERIQSSVLGKAFRGELDSDCMSSAARSLVHDIETDIESPAEAW